ncbi:hypothetical protein NDU88_002745 [Pleurodeles waltl]|uniref:Uncharacterized protein n=1 Tax=Pleurodeles waltl TaxID=8319 RepID=A0AAV7MNZ1_PLEWA|nr:hypothetical protein NDU88_002745 [Pleurodeles waltl]
MQPAVLEDSAFCESTGQQIISYLEFNADTASSHSIEWDMFKAAFLGHCIGFGIGARRQLDREGSAIERQLLRHESEGVQNPSVLSQLLAVRKNNSALIELLRCLNYAAHSVNVYARADRASALLARLI